jgi:hypothetical protein
LLSRLQGSIVFLLPALMGLPRFGLASEPLATHETTHTQLQRFVAEPFEQPLGYSYVSGKALERVLERFGKPDRHIKSQGQDRTSERIWTGHAMHYDGLKVFVVEDPAEPWSWIETITITGNKYPLKFGLNIGSTHEDVIAAFCREGFTDSGNSLHFSASVQQDGHEFELELSVEYDDEGIVTKFILGNYED